MKIDFYFKRIKDSLFYFGAALVKLPMAIITSPIFAKNLSASDFAAIGYFNTLSTFLMPILAFMFYNFYMTGFHERSKERNNEILQSLVSFLLIVDILIVAVAFGILHYYLKISGSNFDAYPLGLIVFITAMFNMAIGFWGIKLRFERKSFKYFLLQTILMLLSLGLALIFVVKYQMGATGRLLPRMIFNILLFGLFFIIFIKRVKIDVEIIRKAIKFSYPLVLSGLLALPIFYLDKIFLEQIHNDDEFGLYNIGATIAGYYGMTVTALFQAFQPDIFKYVGKRNKSSLIQLLIILIVIFIIGGVGYSYISPYAVDYLTAGRYVASSKYITLFVIVLALQPLTYFFSYIIIALKITKLELLNQIIMAIISVIIYSVLINNYQYFGALYAKIIVLLILLGLTSFEIINRNSTFIKRFLVADADRING